MTETNELQIKILPFHTKYLALRTIFRKGSRPGGGIGRRAGFKIQFWQQSAGSIPAPGTNEEESDFYKVLPFFCNRLVSLNICNVFVRIDSIFFRLIQFFKKLIIIFVRNITNRK